LSYLQEGDDKSIAIKSGYSNSINIKLIDYTAPIPPELEYIGLNADGHAEFRAILDSSISQYLLQKRSGNSPFWKDVGNTIYPNGANEIYFLDNNPMTGEFYYRLYVIGVNKIPNVHYKDKGPINVTVT